MRAALVFELPKVTLPHNPRTRARQFDRCGCGPRNARGRGGSGSCGRSRTMRARRRRAPLSNLLALTFVRPGELRAAEWAEVNLDGAVWVHPRREDEDAPPAPRPPRAARHGDPARALRHHRARQVCLPVRSLTRALHEREHRLRRSRLASPSGCSLISPLGQRAATKTSRK